MKINSIHVLTFVESCYASNKTRPRLSIRQRLGLIAQHLRTFSKMKILKVSKQLHITKLVNQERTSPEVMSSHFPPTSSLLNGSTCYQVDENKSGELPKQKYIPDEDFSRIVPNQCDMITSSQRRDFSKHRDGKTDANREKGYTRNFGLPRYHNSSIRPGILKQNENTYNLYPIQEPCNRHSYSTQTSKRPIPSINQVMSTDDKYQDRRNTRMTKSSIPSSTNWMESPHRRSHDKPVFLPRGKMRGFGSIYDDDEREMENQNLSHERDARRQQFTLVQESRSFEKRTIQFNRQETRQQPPLCEKKNLSQNHSFSSWTDDPCQESPVSLGNTKSIFDDSRITMTSPDITKSNHRSKDFVSSTRKISLKNAAVQTDFTANPDHLIEMKVMYANNDNYSVKQKEEYCNKQMTPQNSITYGNFCQYSSQEKVPFINLKKDAELAQERKHDLESPYHEPQSLFCSVIDSTTNSGSNANKSKRKRRKCCITDCQNRVVQGGFCISHGAKRKKCGFPGCEKHVKCAGRCSAHGPPRKRCGVEGCNKAAIQLGRCVAHGAQRKRCSNMGCFKVAILRGMCKKHGEEFKLPTNQGSMYMPI